MQWSTELDLALDIDEVTAAETHLRGNAARCAEGKISEADDRETVYLADLFARSLDAHRLAADLLLEAAVDAIAAPELGVDGELHLRLADDVLIGIGGELIGFLQEIDKAAQVGRQSIRVAGHPRGLLDHPSDRVAVERAELLAAADGADQPRIEQRRFGRPFNAVVEIGCDFEEVGEFLGMVVSV